jgi:hypothetical protein
LFFPFLVHCTRKNLATLVRKFPTGLSAAPDSFAVGVTLTVAAAGSSSGLDVASLAAPVARLECFTGIYHRNLSTRTHMLELLLQTFWAKKLVKSQLISALEKVIYYIGTFLQGSTKPLFTTQNRVEIMFFSTCMF